jgi:predicted nucleotidyltransferase
MTPSVDERAFDERIALAQDVAAVLYNAGAHRVWLFGSLGRGQRQDRRSDIDLAVEGLRASNHSGAVALARHIARGRVDVVPLDATAPSLRAMILKDRILIPPPGGDNMTVERVNGDGRFASTLYHQRLTAALETIRASRARRVIDFGCGVGRLVQALARDDQLEAITGVDYSHHALETAKQQIARTVPAQQRKRVTLIEGLLTHCNPAYLGYDAAAAVEVVEHLEEPQLRAFVHVVFDFARPATIVVTTPNREYNANWEISTTNGLRQEGHRFEWTRDEFRVWASEVAGRHGYTAAFWAIGTPHAIHGAPTQMVVFRSTERL